MNFTPPTVQNFKDQFFRDFPYGNDPKCEVLDADINNAFTYANVNFNPQLFCDQPTYSLGYLLLAAHYLVLNLRQSSQGLSGQFNFTQNAKSAGSVSEAFTIPQRIIDNPEFAMFCKTNYGAQYLMLVLPLLSGQTFTVGGRTKP